MGILEDILEKGSQQPSDPFHFLNRSKKAKRPLMTVSHVGLTSTQWNLEFHPVAGLADLQDDIEALSQRSLDQNLFFGPTVLKAFLPRMQMALKTRQLALLCLFEEMGSLRSLRAFMPVGVVAAGLPGHITTQVLANEFLPDGTPLVDRQHCDEVCDVLFKTLGNIPEQLPDTLNFKLLRDDSKTARALYESAERLNLCSEKSCHHRRASLSKMPLQIKKRRQKEYDRQLRKLAQLGTVSFESVSTLPDVVDAFENHLMLELKGWKGRKGTALYNNHASAGFARAMIVGLAQQNACEIFSITLDHHPIATMVVLGEGSRVLTWKTAYHEKYAALSPGVLLAMHVTEHLQKQPEFQNADSLAIAHHPMINQLWHERIALADWTVALNPKANKRLVRLAAAKNRMARWSKLAKTALGAFKKQA